jgi:glucose-6-phosphate 1-dehydrogenase
MTSATEPLSIVVIGASGDLAHKKVLPALFAVHAQGFLPPNFRVIGFARTEMDDESFREHLSSSLTSRHLPQTDAAAKTDEFLQRCHYVTGDYADTDAYLRIYERLREFEEGRDVNRLYYMAIPPFLFLDVARAIASAGLVNCGGKQGGWSRAVIEKPFGRDRASSDELAEGMAFVFSEDQIYRIDHYLGKEVIQNLLVLRFANRVFWALWGRAHVASVHVSFAEDFGVEGRGGYFDQYGIVRDVMQNHLLQILALLTMERPKRFDANSIRDEKVRLLRAVVPLTAQDIVLGQYGAGTAPDGSPRRAYREEEKVPADSRTPTYAAMRLCVENERWRGVPFLLTAGKGLNERSTRIVITLRPAAGDLFSGPNAGIGPNRLEVRVQPDESILLHIATKVPGLELALAERTLDMHYSTAFPQVLPEAYETLLLDAVRGDKSLFIRRDELDAAWDIFTPALHEIERAGAVPEPYVFGSEGPQGARALIESLGQGGED